MSMLFIYSFLILIYSVITTPEKGYGEFKLLITDVELCKGPKRRDCCVIDGKIENGVILAYDMQILENVIPTKGKIIAMSNGQPLVRLQMKKPCEHLFMGPLFRSILNVTPNCAFKKGSYALKINLEDVAQKYYGGNFLYGNITFKSVFYSDDCNISCTVVQVEITPKNTTSA